MADENQTIFSLDKLYVKDISLEIPNAPKIFLKREQPNIELNVDYSHQKIDEDIYQVIVRAVVDAKVEKEQMFLIELEQAGIFRIKNVPENQLDLVLNVECTTIIFPYLREAITDLTTRAGFMPVILAPVNFAFLNQQKINTIN